MQTLSVHWRQCKRDNFHPVMVGSSLSSRFALTNSICGCNDVVTFFILLLSSRPLHLTAERVGLRCPLPDGRPWATCGWGGGHLQGQTDRSHIQPPDYRTGILINNNNNNNTSPAFNCVLNCVCSSFFLFLFSPPDCDS